MRLKSKNKTNYNKKILSSKSIVKSSNRNSKKFIKNSYNKQLKELNKSNLIKINELTKNKKKNQKKIL